jgi:GNAT superfamily N-acetyltransferase
VTDTSLVVIEQLHELTSSSVGELVAESERFGLRLVRRLTEEWTTGANRFNRPGEILFGASMAGRLVGVCGLNVDPYSGDERVGRVRHLYVLAAFRRRGVGRQLVERVMQAAHGRFDEVRLRTNDQAAARLYEALGFRRDVGQRDYTHVVRLTPVL